MKQENRNKGRRGEDIAVKLLLDKGYEIVERNYGNKFGEIDVIARDGETLVFVEVKAKEEDWMGSPEEMVGKGKLHKVRTMATLYLQGEAVPCRIDVIAVVFAPDGEVLRLTHYENVY